MNYLLLFLCVLGLSAGQVLFKKSATILETLETPWKLYLNGLFIGALIIYGITTLGWVWALQNTPLSRAYMIMALAFIIVPTLSYFIFKEPLTLRFAFGVCLIITGVILTIKA